MVEMSGPLPSCSLLLDDSIGSGVPCVCSIRTEKVLFREKGSWVKMSRVVPFGDWLEQLSW